MKDGARGEAQTFVACRPAGPTEDSTATHFLGLELVRNHVDGRREDKTMLFFSVFPWFVITTLLVKYFDLGISKGSLIACVECRPVSTHSHRTGKSTTILRRGVWICFLPMLSVC